jgi:hypothetical protein
MAKHEIIKVIISISEMKNSKQRILQNKEENILPKIYYMLSIYKTFRVS